MKKPHTSTHPGKRVRIRLRGGVAMMGKFVDSNDRWVMVDVNGRVTKIRVRDIDTFNIWREQPRRAA